jgi:hypothetical protein
MFTIIIARCEGCPACIKAYGPCHHHDGMPLSRIGSKYKQANSNYKVSGSHHGYICCLACMHVIFMSKKSLQMACRRQEWGKSPEQESTQ